mgnify:CR=1 FL=1
MNIKFALAGNPNCGKTTMFNALTGANQYVGNWPGVTVEKKEGKIKGNKEDNITVVDLPGIYSLSPYTLEEVVSRDFLLNEDPDVIIDLVDATNIERNLYLTTQLIETGVPVVIALNMADLIEKRGLKIDTKRLSMVLGCPIIETSALKGTGLKELIAEAVKVAKKSEHQLPQSIFSEKIEKAIDTVVPALSETITANKKRWYAVKVLENDEKVMNHIVLSNQNKTTIDSLRKELETELDDDMESIITDGRYTYIQKLISTTVEKPKEKLTMSDKIDKIVTNRFLGIPIFLAVMFVVYYISVTTIGTFVTDWTNDVFVVAIQDAVSGFLGSVGASSLLTAVIVDGIIGGVGAVIGFAPQMAILFLFLSILEDCGYMVRIAFVMDRVFRYFGLSGKSFIPLLIGSGCGIPAIMASKTIEQDNDRRLTIMTATFIPCGAKLPVIALLGGVMAGKVAGWKAAGFIAPAMYFVGIAAVLVAAIMLKKTKPFSGKPAPFVMELPAYHWPTVGNVLRSMWERGWSFIKKAGTIILLSTIVLWFLMNFGWSNGTFGMLDFDGLEGAALEAAQAECVLAKVGSAIAWIFAPLGWTKAGNGWKMAVAAVSGLIAKENVVATFGQLFGFAEVAEDGSEIWKSLSLVMTPVAAYGFLVFNLLCAPCFAAMGAIKREMNNVKWFWFAIGYQCILAYIVSLCIYQIGTLITVGTFGVGTVVAFLLIIGFIYLLFRPYKESNTLNFDAKKTVSAK